MPKWRPGLTDVKVVGRKENVVRIEFVSERNGKTAKSAASLSLWPPSGVVSEDMTRLAQVTWTVRFEEANGGTMATAIQDVKVRGAWAAIFAPRGVEPAQRSAKAVLDSFAAYVEGLP